MHAAAISRIRHRHGHRHPREDVGVSVGAVECELKECLEVLKTVLTVAYIPQRHQPLEISKLPVLEMGPTE